MTRNHAQITHEKCKFEFVSLLTSHLQKRSLLFVILQQQKKTIKVIEILFKQKKIYAFWCFLIELRRSIFQAKHFRTSRLIQLVIYQYRCVPVSILYHFRINVPEKDTITYKQTFVFCFDSRVFSFFHPWTV